MATVYADVSDVQQARGQEIPESQQDWVQGRVDAAHRRLRSAAPGLDARAAAGALDPDLVKDVIVEMVLRVLRNPEGLLRENDGDYGYGRSERVGSGVLEVTAADLEVLGYAGASTYSVTYPDGGLPRPWIPDPCRSQR
ncbi:predicted 14.0Kd protein [Alloactinosynnema sp. L-07]|uniref:Gp19/Gp15/Gp42 family protein n=1 Tax=Alloactinosynnema sp. L-07 TaxID=1653480 RepID=UPI00065EF258|nr:Gp19/Gp15/Gp42 family protein [Alloactinosynnema sp. L-07]CRK59071.1 predicted 14.0Kd protein [Alloactinosynnema sp. L-07]